MAMRAASICRSVIHAALERFQSYSPKLIILPRTAIGQSSGRASACDA